MAKYEMTNAAAKRVMLKLSEDRMTQSNYTRVVAVLRQEGFAQPRRAVGDLIKALAESGHEGHAAAIGADVARQLANRLDDMDVLRDGFERLGFLAE